MSDLVSILIPIYNAEKWLRKTICCAVEQTWSNKEVIIVDDGSTDGSLAIARQFERSDVKVISQENQGACVARNRGLAEAQGDFVQFLDSDDLMNRNKIELQVKRLRAETPGTLASGKWERFYDSSGSFANSEVTFNTKSYYRDYEYGLEWALVAASRKGMFPPHAWLVPRSVTEKIGSWDESLLINQDGEYFNRAVLASSGVAFCEGAKVYYRSGMKDSISQRKDPAALRSKYQSIRQIADQILEEENSPRTREACAIAFQAFAYGAYPDVPRYVEQAIRKAEKPSGSQDYRPGGSDLYQRLHDLLGWRAAKLLRRWYYQLRYDQKI